MHSNSIDAIRQKKKIQFKMRNSRKGEVVLSLCQLQAARLNRVEHRRLENHVNYLEDDLTNHITRIKRQEQGLRTHFTNVVKFIKPNRSYQLWREAHAQEFALEEQLSNGKLFLCVF